MSAVFESTGLHASGKASLTRVPRGVAASIQQGYLVILAIIAAYVIHIPFAVRSNKWLADHPEVWDDKPKAQRQVRREIRRAQHPNRRFPRRSAARLRLRRPGGPQSQ